MNTALRQGTIRLACLHPEDQSWILENLQPSERAQVEAMLEEISLLGLADDQTVVDAIMREPPLLTAREPLIPLDETAHPFWFALGMMTFPESQRSQYIDEGTGGASLAKWNSVFSKELLPPALVQHLSELLRRGDTHESA